MMFEHAISLRLYAMSYCSTLQEQRSGCTLPNILRAVPTSLCHTGRLATLRKNSSSRDLNSASEKKLQQPSILISSSFLLLGNKGPVGDVGDQGMLGKIGPIGGKGELWSGNFLGVFSLKVNMCFMRAPDMEQY